MVRRGETDTKFVSVQKVNSGEENFPATPAGIQTRNLLISCPALHQQAILPPDELNEHLVSCGGTKSSALNG